MKKRIHVFDFDGTLTRSDTLFAFIAYTHGKLRLALTLLCFTPFLVAMKLGFCANGRVKERFLATFFKGMDESRFISLCQNFAAQYAHLLYPEALHTIHQAIAADEKVFVVTASIDCWVIPFFHDIPEVSILGTRIEVANGKLTGRFASPNCYGEEKVRRLPEMLKKNRNAYHIIAYGDSKGDRALFDFADEHHYKPFTHKG